MAKWIAWLEKQGEQKPTDKVEPKFKVKYAGSEYNVLEIKDIVGVIFYGIEDEPNHIDYVKAENCEIIRYNGYGMKENGCSFPTKPIMFSEKKPQRMISAEAKEAMYDKPAWSEEDERIYQSIIDDTVQENQLDSNQIDWLKSLKDRLQLKREWSEYDKWMLESIIYNFGKGRQSTTSQDNWLKSLAPWSIPKIRFV